MRVIMRVILDILIDRKISLSQLNILEDPIMIQAST